jgi:uncharacterized membrane protein YedE/YeeE
MPPLLLALLGGVLIGLSAVALMATLGRIAGISGILGGLLPPAADAAWRIAFLAGLVAGPMLIGAATGTSPIGTPALPPLPLTMAGLLVGVGTGLSRGCTSGHGVCGLARLSRRSALATALFMAAAIATVYVMRHWADT